MDPPVLPQRPYFLKPPISPKKSAQGLQINPFMWPSDSHDETPGAPKSNHVTFKPFESKEVISPKLSGGFVVSLKSYNRTVDPPGSCDEHVDPQESRSIFRDSYFPLHQPRSPSCVNLSPTSGELPTQNNLDSSQEQHNTTELLQSLSSSNPSMESETSSATDPSQQFQRPDQELLPPKRKKRHHYRIFQRQNLVIGSILSLALSLFSLAVLILTMKNPFICSWQDRTIREDKLTICVMCDYLLKNLEEVHRPKHNLKIELKDGKQNCCARNSNQMSELLTLVVAAKKMANKPEIQMTSNPVQIPRAHAYFKPDEIPVMQFKGHYMMIPEEKDTSNQPLVVFRKHSLVITVSGRYYVYSNIFYNNNCNITVEHYIGRYKPHTDTSDDYLAQTSTRCCKNCTLDKRSSFVGGVFMLHTNDEIFVTVSDYKAVSFNKETSYIGILMLGEDVSALMPKPA